MLSPGNHILIVDDDVDFAESLVDLLVPRGYTVYVAHSIEECNEIIKRINPDLALLDVRLGRLSGITLIQTLKDSFPNILCVMMTAYAAIDTAVESLQHGAYDYLRKPLNTKELLATLDRCFDKIKLEWEKVKAQDALQQSEERYRTLIETMSDGIEIQDENGIITYVNDRFCEMVGYERNDLIGLPVTDLLDPTNREIFIENSSHRKNGDPVSYELTWSTRDRMKLATIVSPRILSHEGGGLHGSFAVVTDISDRKRSENFLRIQRDLGMALNKPIDLKEALRLVLDATLQISGLDNGSIYLEDQDKTGFDLVHYEGVSPEYARVMSHLDHSREYVPQLLEGKPVYRAYHELGVNVNDVVRREAMLSYVIFPVMHEDQVIALLALGSHVHKEISMKIRLTLEALASQIGGVLVRLDAENRLLSERATLDNIINLNPYGIIVFNTSGQFVKANRAFLNVFKVEPAEVFSLFKDIFLVRDGLIDQVREVRLGQVVKIDSIWFNPRDYSDQYIDKKMCMSSTFFPIYSPHGSVENIVVMLEDITEQRLAEDARHESEERFKAIVEGARDAIFIKDTERRYTFVNPHMEAIFGKSANWLVGKTALDLFGEEGEETRQENETRVLNGEVIEGEVTIELNGKDSTFHSIRVPMTDSEGNIIGICGIARDVTERKETERKLLDYQKQLQSLATQLANSEESERRRIATELHDRISQNLAFSRIKLGMIREAVNSKSIAKDIAEVRDMVEQAIQSTRSLTFEISPPVLYDLGLEVAIEWLIEDFKKRHDIKIYLQKEEGLLEIEDKDRGVLFQSVRELMTNVIKHADADVMTVSLASSKGQYTITVDDDGKGFDKSILVDASYEDCGFGLFSIRERLNRINGNLVIESEPGKRTRMTIEIPEK